MTKDLKTRYLWNLLFLTIMLVYGIISTTLKAFFANKHFKEGKKYEEIEEYKKVVD